jgi:hypothetical protein
MLYDVMLGVVMLGVVMLGVGMLGVVMLGVVMLNVLAPYLSPQSCVTLAVRPGAYLGVSLTRKK